eukprot:TRINITY_DN2289_c0_g4_i1.p1 TRINITY_DN2289_c0_g4~~TRINITY_DN2289_c0_g4_i1.p1  ORF type:complete len:972 (-),score=134.75 TRINITY_DN2289_c0_g4_i1:90-2570(-)
MEGHGLGRTWIDEYNMLENSLPSQYMWSFQWILTQFTPAPFPFQPQNELEQVFVLIVILVTIPLMGAQIGRVTATLNQMNANSNANGKLKRELQAYLNLTNTPTTLTTRAMRSLQHVLRANKGSRTAPAALNKLPMSLVEELHVSRKSEKICAHPLFRLIMAPGVQLAGPVSSKFQIRSLAIGDHAFQENTLATGMVIIVEGTFQLTSALAADSLWSPVAWFAETSLWTACRHKSTLTALELAEIFALTPEDLAMVVRNSPSTIAAVHEYAEAFLSRVKNFAESDLAVDTPIVEDSLPEEWSDCAIRTTQLFRLLNGVSGAVSDAQYSVETVKNQLPSSAPWSKIIEVMSRDVATPELISDLEKCFAELDPHNGTYVIFQQDGERKRALLGMASAVWLIKDCYENIAFCQTSGTRLSKTTWDELQEFVRGVNLTQDQIHAVLVYLAIRGLCKSKDYCLMCRPSSRRSPEESLAYAMEHLGDTIPSLAFLTRQSRSLLEGIVGILCTFNFAQLLQGENNPQSMALVKGVLQSKVPELLNVYIFSQVCMMCGVTGEASMHGSLFLNETNAKTLLLAIQCVQGLNDADAPQVYWRYITARATALDLSIESPEEFALARLLCLTRTTDQSGLHEVHAAWRKITADEREALTECLLVDGIKFRACIFMFLPLFLANARANPGLGLARAFRGFRELLRKLHRHGAMSSPGSTVTIDIAGLASIASRASSCDILVAAIEKAEIIRIDESKVSLIMTQECWSILTEGTKSSRQADILDRLHEILGELHNGAGVAEHQQWAIHDAQIIDPEPRIIRTGTLHAEGDEDDRVHYAHY